MDINQLIKDCQANNIIAQRLLYEQYCNQLFTCCKRYIKNNEDAEECLMNGYLKIFKSIKTFEGDSVASFYGWMKKIIINECLMKLRKKNELLFIEMDDSIMDAFMEPDVIAEINAKEIYALIQELPAGYKSIFNLYVVDQLTHKEIATLLKINEGTSKSQLNKARAYLKRLMNNQNNINNEFRKRG